MPSFALKLPHEFKYLSFYCYVKGCCRLVGYKQGRAAGKGLWLSLRAASFRRRGCGGYSSNIFSGSGSPTLPSISIAKSFASVFVFFWWSIIGSTDLVSDGKGRG